MAKQREFEPQAGDVLSAEPVCRLPSPADALLPDGAACFAPDAEDGPEALRAALLQLLDERRHEAEADPFANPLLLLSLDVKRRLDGGVWSYGAVEQLIQLLTIEAFATRAERMAIYLGALEPGANLARLRELIAGLATDRHGGPADFESFRAALERAWFGIVVTGHPTFGLDAELYRALAQLAAQVDEEDRPLDMSGRAALLERARRREHRAPRGLDLAYEQALATEAVGRMHGALHELYRVALDVARERYPEQWRSLVPRLVTVASWVGFDLDGRSDIGWATTFTTALRNQLAQLARYRAQCAAMRARAARHPALGHVVSLIDARFALAERDAAAACEAFAPGAGDLETLRRQAKAMHAGRSDRLVSAAPVIELVDAALALDPPDDLALELCAMRAALVTHGLGLAHVHARINAAQLHNAVRKLVGMETGPDDPTRKWTYQEAIEGLIETAEPATINFGSILDEETSARRVFMLIAQMLKYVDADQPVRFLIAECETAFTLLGALYFARLFGIEDKLDISPLFETRRALAEGHTVVAEALRSPAFRAYVRRRGRLCIETGYSDAGRYLGQTAAAAAIGRLRSRIGDLLLEAGLGDVELVFFDTHGESIGRGGHPASLAERLRYVDDPGVRRRFVRDGIRQKQEVSFQGGDGYVYFLTAPTALAALTRIMEHVLEPPDEGADPADTETAYVEQFFNAVGQFNARLMADQDFGTLLGVYGTNLLYPSGSRSTKRQHDTPGARVDLDHPSQLRAIPQNAILQQLGCLANTIGGLGQAVREDPERFQRLYRDSSRFRRLMNMVEYAFMFTDLDVLKAYVDLFDPGMWLARAARRGDDTRADELATVARVMEGEGLNERLGRVIRRLRSDHRELALALREHRRRAREEGEQPIVVTAEDRDNMHMLHALRLGLIQKLMLLAVHLPQFSGRHEVTREDLIHRLIHLDVTWAVEQLNEIFPMQEERVATRDFGEIATYQNDASQGYAHEHLTLFRPLAAIYELIRRIGSGVMHNVGALG